MSDVATIDAAEFTEDHISWLLIAAHTYLQQQVPERAVTLLEFIQVLDPDNPQCLKMLAQGYLLQGRLQECLRLTRLLLDLPLTDTERVAIYLLQLRVSLHSRESGDTQQLYQDYTRQIALVSADASQS